MKRWAIALSIVLATVFATIAFVRAPNPRTIEPVDEILAYEIGSGKSVTLEIPGGMDEILVSSWGLPKGPGPISSDPLPFAVHATFRDPAGQIVLERSLANETKLDPRSRESGALTFRAKLLDSEEAVSDPRTLSILTEAKVPRGGTLELGLEPGPLRSLLVRVLRRETRAPLEQAAYLRGLDLPSRRELADGRFSLGYEDLPTEVQLRAVSTWGRRLEAVGKEGRDYTVRRLLLGRGERTSNETLVSSGFPIDPKHALPLNFLGPVRFRVKLSAPAKLEILGKGAVKTIATDPLSVLVDDATVGPHTVSFLSDAPVLVRVLAEEAPARAQISGKAALPHADGWEVAVDQRNLRVLQLDPASPVRFNVKEGAVRVSCVVSLAQEETTATRPITLRFPGANVAPFVSEIAFTRSLYDRFKDGSDATAFASSVVLVPEKAKALELLGPSTLRCLVQQLDPQIPADVYELPYRVALPPDVHWVHAPFDLKRWTTVLPENLDALEREKRSGELVGLVRIEPRDGNATGGPKPEMVVEPLGQPVQRHFLEPAFLGKGFPLPAEALLRTDGKARVRIVGSGPHARKLDVNYVVHPDALGQTLTLDADGKQLASERLITASGHLKATLDEGPHSIELGGAKGAFFLDAAPEDGGAIYRRRTVFEVKAERELYFRFPQAEGARLTLWLFVVTDNLKESWRLRYWLQAGSVRRGVLLRGLTAEVGVISGKNGEQGGGLLWEGSPEHLLTMELRQGIGRAPIRLADDHSGGLREVRVRIEEPSRAWVRAVVVGESEQSPKTRESAWVTNED